MMYKIDFFIFVKKLMTKKLFFFENKEDSKKFCFKKDIDKLPMINSDKHYMFFNKQTRRFTKKEVKKEDTISAKSTLSEFMRKTKKRGLLFVFENKKIVGVIHFCDLINSSAYVYFYSILNAFEILLKEELINLGKGNKDIFAFLE